MKSLLACLWEATPLLAVSLLALFACVPADAGAPQAGATVGRSGEGGRDQGAERACGKPQRIAVAGAAAAEVALALGVQPRIAGADVGAMRTGLIPEHLPVFGYVRNLPVEGLAALGVDLVLATAEAGPPQALGQLARLGVRVERLEGGHGLDAVLARVRRAGALLGERQRAEQLAQRVETEVRMLVERVESHSHASGGAPSVLWVLHPGGGAPLAGGRGTAAAALLELVGAHNVADSLEGWKPMGAEAIRAADPTWVVLGAAEFGLGVLDARSAETLVPGLGGTSALARGRILAVDQSLMLSGGPRLSSALHELARHIYPSLDLSGFDPWDPCAP